MTARIIIIASTLLAASCATARPDATGRCQSLLDQRDALLWVAAFSGGLAGAGGLGTAIPDDDRRDVRLGLGISTAALAAAASSATMLGRLKASRFSAECQEVAEPEVIDAGPAEVVRGDGGAE